MILKQKTVRFLLVDGKEVLLSEHEVNALRRELCDNDDWRVMALRGMKIDAIKSVRALCGLGLKEAKDLIELFVKERGQQRDEALSLLGRGHAPGQCPDDDCSGEDDIPF